MELDIDAMDRHFNENKGWNQLSPGPFFELWRRKSLVHTVCTYVEMSIVQLSVK